jgi:hypothetical protein
MASTLLRFHRHVYLVQGDELRQQGQPLAVEGEFAVQDVEIAEGIAPGHAAHVQDVDQQARPLDVPQELMSQPDAFARALDDAGMSAMTKLRSAST